MASQPMIRVARAASAASQQLIQALRRGEDVINAYNANGLADQLPVGDDDRVHNGSDAQTREQLVAQLTLLATAARALDHRGIGDNTLLGTPPLSAEVAQQLVRKLGV